MKLQKYIYFLIVPLLVLSSCSEVYLEESIDRQIVVFAAIGGAGDNGYNDLVTRGLTRVYMDHSGASMNYLTPETMEHAESSIYKWIEEGSRKAAHTLLVLAASDYRDVAERILRNPDLKPENEVEILIFEIPELPQSQNNIKAYSFMISMNEASYQAGVYAARMGCANPLVWLAYDDAQLLKAADGFDAGYESVTGLTPDRRYLSDDWHGYIMDRETYMQMEEKDSLYDFIYPVMGGSNMGIYRYLREHPDGPWVVGMDVDQSSYSSRVVGSVIKHLDGLLEQIVRSWINGVPIEQYIDHYKEYDTQSGYIEWRPVAD